MHANILRLMEIRLNHQLLQGSYNKLSVIHAWSTYAVQRQYFNASVAYKLLPLVLNTQKHEMLDKCSMTARGQYVSECLCKIISIPK